MTVSLPLGRVGSTRLYMHASLLLGALVLLLSGYALQLGVLLGSLLFHELGHILAAASLGAEVTRVDLWPFGASAKITGSWDMGPTSEGLVALAGPFNSGLLASLASALERTLAPSGLFAGTTFPLLQLLIKANLGLVIVNLIPCLPLDGGRFLRSRLSGKMGFVPATKRMVRWGYVSGAFLALAGALLAFFGKGWSPVLLVGPLVVWGAHTERETLQEEGMMHVLTRSDRLRRRRAISVEELMVPLDATVGEVVRRLKPSRYHMILVAGKDMAIVGRMPETRVLEAFFDGQVHLRMKDLLWGVKPR